MRATGAALVAGTERMHLFDDTFDEIEPSCCDYMCCPRGDLWTPGLSPCDRRCFCAMCVFLLQTSERGAAPSLSSTLCPGTCVREQTCFEPTLAWRSCFSHVCTCFPFPFSFYSVACGRMGVFFFCHASFPLAKLQTIRCTFQLFHPLPQDAC